MNEDTEIIDLPKRIKEISNRVRNLSLIAMFVICSLGVMYALLWGKMSAFQSEIEMNRIARNYDRLHLDNTIKPCLNRSDEKNEQRD